MVELDTTDPLNSSIAVSGTDITIDIGGFLLTDGEVTFSQRTVGGVKIVDVAISAKADFGASDRCPRSSPGALQIGPAGLAGVLAITDANISLGGSFSVSAATLRFEINRSTQAVVLSDLAEHPARGRPLHPHRRRGDRARSRRHHAHSIRLVPAGDERRRCRHAPSSRSQAAKSRSAPTAPLLTGVDGLIVLTPAGMAMSLAGTLDLGALLPDGVTIAGSFFLQMNNAAVRVTESGDARWPHRLARPHRRAVRPRRRHRHHPLDRRTIPRRRHRVRARRHNHHDRARERLAAHRRRRRRHPDPHRWRGRDHARRRGRRLRSRSRNVRFSRAQWRSRCRGSQHPPRWSSTINTATSLFAIAATDLALDIAGQQLTR